MNPNSARMNFLVQAAQSVAERAGDFSRFYGKCLKEVAHKSAIKLDFTIKRQLCKCCHALLVPGVNCKYRIRKKKSKKSHPVQVLTCLHCKKQRTLPLKRNKERKVEKEGEISEISPSEPMEKAGRAEIKLDLPES